MNNFMDAFGGITPDVGHTLLKTFAEVSEQNRKEKQLSLDRQKMVQNSTFKDMDMDRKQSDLEMRATFKAAAELRNDERFAWEKKKWAEEAPTRAERIEQMKRTTLDKEWKGKKSVADEAAATEMQKEIHGVLDDSGEGTSNLLDDLESDDPTTLKAANQRANNILSKYPKGAAVDSVAKMIIGHRNFVAKQGAQAARLLNKDEDQKLARERLEASQGALALAVRKHEEVLGKKPSNGLDFGDEKASIPLGEKQSITMAALRAKLAQDDSSQDRDTLVNILNRPYVAADGHVVRPRYSDKTILEWTAQGRAAKEAKEAKEAEAELKKQPVTQTWAPRETHPGAMETRTAAQISATPPTAGQERFATPAIVLPPMPSFGEIQDTKKGFDAFPGNQTEPTTEPTAAPAEVGTWRVSPRDPNIEINDTTKQARRKQ